MRRYLFFFLLMFSLNVSNARAAEVFRYCDHASSSADIMSCVKQQYDQAAEKLNTVYEAALEKQSDKEIEAFRKAQNDWIVYRNAQCEWQNKHAGTGSLGRIKSLSCLEEMTLERTEALSKALGLDEKDVQSLEVKEVFPRWMNVVAEENPHVYWQYGKRIAVDLNCDGNDEFIMPGAVLEKGSKQGSVLGVVESLPTGRPVAHILPLGIKSDNILCLPSYSMAVDKTLSEVGQTKAEGEGAVSKLKCGARITIVPHATHCSLDGAEAPDLQKVLLWRGQKPIFEEKEELDVVQ